jgi:hypothetical protein
MNHNVSDRCIQHSADNSSSQLCLSKSNASRGKAQPIPQPPRTSMIRQKRGE